MKAKVCRYYDGTSNRYGIVINTWHVAVYWTYDPDKCPHDYDLYMTPAEWRKWSGLPSPKEGRVLEVEIGVKRSGEFKVKEDDE